MRPFESFRWWLRGIRVLRYPSLVRGLGVLKAQWDTFEQITAAYKGQEFKLARTAIVENWAPHRLTVGHQVTVEHGSILSWPGDDDAWIEIGDHTWIGPYNNLRTAPGGRLTIGRHCLISQFCSLITHNHGMSGGETIQSQPHSEQRCNVTIGDDVWLGAGCAVMPGVSIGCGAVVGAGAVVTRDVPDQEIWAGVPAQKVGERS